jgi:farnesyl diphosphate synthase
MEAAMSAGERGPVAQAASGMDLKAWSSERLARVEVALEQWVHAELLPRKNSHHADSLAEAMRYAVLGGGKRLRPLLVFAAHEAVSGSARVVATQASLRAACAVELIHAYSLVHDDMPCMDDDVLRRGKPTVHVRYGEATALLAGDALQALAFELLTPADASIALSTQARLCALLSRAAGAAGMAGGQAIDLASVGERLDEETLRHMHELKTGALLQASVLMGAQCGDPTPDALAGLKAYGHAIGLAFQVVDDILDVTADSAVLGKTAGKDAAHGKPTYVSLMGLQASRAYAQELLAQSLAGLDASGLVHTAALRALADTLVHRAN